MSLTDCHAVNHRVRVSSLFWYTKVNYHAIPDVFRQRMHFVTLILEISYHHNDINLLTETTEKNIYGDLKVIAKKLKRN